MAPPFHYVDLRSFAYATEDEERVVDALGTLLPEDFPIDRAESEGHYGDRIVVRSARVENADGIRHVLDRLLDADEFTRILNELDERVTENCEFYLTLDKQAAFGGDVALGDGITLRAKIEAYPAKREAAIENARDAFETLLEG